MLKEGKNSFKSQDNIDFICSSGESISITDNYADVVTVSFGIRNMTDREKCLQECHRILKPGGVFACLEFSLPRPKKINYDDKSLNENVRSFYKVSKKVYSNRLSNDLNYKLIFPKVDDFFHSLFIM